MSIKKGHTNVVVIFCITQPILSAEVDADNQFCDSLVFISLSVTEVRGQCSGVRHVWYIWMFRKIL